jgi:hypothetical protein
MHSSKHKHLPAREKSFLKKVSVSKREINKKILSAQNSTSTVFFQPYGSTKEETGTFQSLTLNTQNSSSHQKSYTDNKICEFNIIVKKLKDNTYVESVPHETRMRPSVDTVRPCTAPRWPGNWQMVRLVSQTKRQY